MGTCFAYQMGKCAGACIGKESPDEYNERLTSAFETRKLRAWPYSGTVMIDERGSEDSGTVLFIRDWVLLGAYTYEGEAFEPLFKDSEQPGFDYDTYKILARYLLNSRNRRSVTTLTEREYRNTMNRITGVVEEGVYTERVMLASRGLQVILSLPASSSL
jgi:DNA polymerase-3 subunit epsilon